jgi:hypothetical protein
MSNYTDQKPIENALIWHCSLNNIIIYQRGPLNSIFHQHEDSLLFQKENKNDFFSCSKYIWLLGNNTTAYMICYQNLLPVFPLVQVLWLDLKFCACIVMFIQKCFLSFYSLLIYLIFLCIICGSQLFWQENASLFCLLTGTPQQISISFCPNFWNKMHFLIICMLVYSCLDKFRAIRWLSPLPGVEIKIRSMFI